MARKRDRLEIIHDILEVVRDHRGVVRPTHILYKSNLSHPMLTEYLNELLAKGFIVQSFDKQGKKSYELTDKGHNYLRDYAVIRGFVDSYGLD
jgi:predicted transcriptional regulator